MTSGARDSHLSCHPHPFSNAGMSARTDAGWPDYLRVNPLYNFRYDQIWALLRGLWLPYAPMLASPSPWSPWADGRVVDWQGTTKATRPLGARRRRRPIPTSSPRTTLASRATSPPTTSRMRRWSERGGPSRLPRPRHDPHFPFRSFENVITACVLKEAWAIFGQRLAQFIPSGMDVSSPCKTKAFSNSK